MNANSTNLDKSCTITCLLKILKFPKKQPQTLSSAAVENWLVVIKIDQSVKSRHPDIVLTKLDYISVLALSS